LVVSSSAEIVAPGQVARFSSILTDPDFVRCQQQSVAVPSQGSDAWSLTELQPPVGAIADFRVTGSTGSGRGASAYTADLAYVASGRVLCSITVLATRGLPNADLKARLVGQLTRKLQDQ
nr:hypothetical protein [Micromonospora sp. DSM 115978]